MTKKRRPPKEETSTTNSLPKGLPKGDDALDLEMVPKAIDQAMRLSPRVDYFAIWPKKVTDYESIPIQRIKDQLAKLVPADPSQFGKISIGQYKKNHLYSQVIDEIAKPDEEPEPEPEKEKPVGPVTQRIRDKIREKFGGFSPPGNDEDIKGKRRKVIHGKAIYTPEELAQILSDAPRLTYKRGVPNHRRHEEDKAAFITKWGPDLLDDIEDGTFFNPAYEGPADLPAQVVMRILEKGSEKPKKKRPKKG